MNEDFAAILPDFGVYNGTLAVLPRRSLGCVVFRKSESLRRLRVEGRQRLVVVVHEPYAERPVHLDVHHLHDQDVHALAQRDLGRVLVLVYARSSLNLNTSLPLR